MQVALELQLYAVELCEKYAMDIDLDFLSVDIDGRSAVVRLIQTASYTDRQTGETETYVAELEHEMISYQGIWNILSTEWAKERAKGSISFLYTSRYPTSIL